MKLAMIVCGDRWYTDADAVQDAIDTYQPDVVIEGEARGADTFGRNAAEARGIRVLPFPISQEDWRRYRRGAGPRRNTAMLRCLLDLRAQGWRVLVLAFHDSIEESRGTADMLGQAQQAGVDGRLYERAT